MRLSGFGDRAVPDLVVASALAFAVAAGVAQQPLDRRREVVGHSRRNRRPFMPFRHDGEGDVARMIGGEQAVRFEQLGITTFSLSTSTSASSVSAPVARPGTSSLAATQTAASAFQLQWTV